MEETPTLGQQLAARRQIVESQCVVCGKPIRGTVRRRLCSNRCKVEAYQQRRRAAQAEAGEQG